MHALIEILHPAHVHFFRHFAAEMAERGHRITMTARHKDVAIQLLERYGMGYETLSSQGRGAFGLAGELLVRTRRLHSVVRRERPDVLTGIMGPTIALVGRATRTPSIVFYDTETSVRTNPWVFRLAGKVCTPEAYRGPVPEERHVRYRGYHELAYLHPNRFSPRPERLRGFGVEPGERFAFVRFVSWEASHDLGDQGLPSAAKRRVVEHLQDRVGRVLVSHEGRLPGDLPGERLSGPVEDIHHLLWGAEIVVGDSATMSSEAAVLGTPAVFVSPVRLGYLLDLESRYGLVVNLHPDSAEELTSTIDATLHGVAVGHPVEAVARLRRDSVDVTEWMVDFFERELSDTTAS